MATIIGTPSSETLTGTDLADSILGVGGNDVINSLAGNDTLDGGADNDTLRGGIGNDLLFGGLGKDLLFGDAGNDQLFGGGLRDRLNGGDGNDRLDGGTGSDVMLGGKGDDVYIADRADDEAIELFFEGTDEVRASSLSYTLSSNIEILTFIGSGSFVGVGNAESNVITGGSGNDSLDGASGPDLLIGAAGRDTLIGGQGNDRLDGGTGRDKLFSGEGDDRLLGRDFNDTLQGGIGNDVLDGGSGSDTARFSGVESDYRIRRVDDKVEVVDLNKADGDDGTDLLSGVEVLQFKDGAVSPPTVISAINLAELDGINGFTLFTFSKGAELGLSVSEVGDVNGDGFDDQIVGAPGYSVSIGGDYYYTYGRSYVVFGKANWAGSPEVESDALDGTDGFIFTGELESRLGYSVSSAGDVNGDGFADLIVGAPGQYLPYDSGNQNGRAYVVFGKTDWTETPILNPSALDGSNGFKLVHAGAYDYAGFSVSSAGDINGDGLHDLVVGVPNEANTGASYVVFGKADWTGTPQLDLEGLDGKTGFRLEGAAPNEGSGASVSSAGDVNGDGLDDLIIGAPGVGQSGNAYVVFGKANWAGTPSLELDALDGTNGFRITGDNGGLLGRSVHGAGDVNGDGIADIIVGSPDTPSYPSSAGESYVIFGKSSWTGTPVSDVANLDGSNGFRLIGGGFSVSSAGEVNGDGHDDLIVGAPEQDKAYVVYGKADWTGTPALDLAALDGTDGLELIGGGSSVSSAGDVNHDGFDDLLVGSPGAAQGRAFVVFGGNFNNAAVQVSAQAQALEQDLSLSSG